MSHDIFLVVFHSGYTLYIFLNPYRLYQPRSLRRRQIDLRHIAGNDHFRIHTQSGKKHFYLVCGRVLRLIEKVRKASMSKKHEQAEKKGEENGR